MTSSLLSPRELSRYLGIPEGTLSQWRAKGTGPKRIRLGRHVRYRMSDVEAFLDQQAQGGCNAA